MMDNAVEHRESAISEFCVFPATVRFRDNRDEIKVLSECPQVET